MSRRRGNDNENAFMAMAEALGYCAFAARGSRGVIDVVCFEDRVTIERALKGSLDGTWPLTPLVVQVGTAAKPIASTLAELAAAPRPIGSLCIVARRMPLKAGRRSWKFSTPHGNFDSLEQAINERFGGAPVFAVGARPPGPVASPPAKRSRRASPAQKKGGSA